MELPRKGDRVIMLRVTLYDVSDLWTLNQKCDHSVKVITNYSDGIPLECISVNKKIKVSCPDREFRLLNKCDFGKPIRHRLLNSVLIIYTLANEDCMRKAVDILSSKLEKSRLSTLDKITRFQDTLNGEPK